MRKTTSKTFRTAFPKSVPLTEWTNKTNRCFANSDLSGSDLTNQVVSVFSTSSKPLTIKQVERRVYGRKLRTMNPSTHVRRIVKKLVWEYPSLFFVTRETGKLELSWK